MTFTELNEFIEFSDKMFIKECAESQIRNLLHELKMIPHSHEDTGIREDL